MVIEYDTILLWIYGGETFSIVIQTTWKRTQKGAVCDSNKTRAL